MQLILVLVALVAICHYVVAQPGNAQPIYINPAANCSFSYNGSNYDFSSLMSKSGGYSWQQTWNNTAFTIQLQVCGNIAHPSVGCPGSASANFVTSTQCLSGGQGSLFSWDQNPYEDGFFLTYYHGSFANNVQSYSTRIYFMCDAKTGTPSLEHFTSDFQAHIAWNTPLACPSSRRA